MRANRLTYQPVLAAGLDPAVMLVMLSLRNPEFDVSEAIAMARSVDGLIVTEADAEREIANGMIWAAFSAEAVRRSSRYRRTAREFNAKRMVEIEKLRHLHAELEADARMFAEFELQALKEPSRARPEFMEAMGDLSKAIESLTRWTTVQTLIFQGAGGYHRPFDNAFVRAMREVWFNITGHEAGVARKGVIEFAALIWEAYGFPNQSNRPLVDWLFDRFSKVR
ncbi:hypothetical protein OE766_24295 [Pararhizobium sp. YC-54]|uniref:hypothetical protein n=1 Tax=Pararhizobium sp. YC-54 TaxID=2986920 RepID=UPI0021F787D7|nr:hypothetical protein [Pararhizobium sp. YC-54]MCW0001346.1 hypothetical protein [Pararhizobium sp. YC-54]